MSLGENPLADGGSCARLLAVLVAYNSEAVIGRAVDALADAAHNLRREMGFETELVVVDNASRESASVSARALRTTVIRLSENLGFAPAANLGSRARPSSLILFLNPDTVLAPASLAALVATFAEPTTAIAGPLLVSDDGRAILSERPFHSIRREIRTQLLPSRSRRPFGRRQFVSGRGRCLTGACLLVDRDFFESCGGFDETIRMYLEDVDLCWRAHELRREVRFVGTAECVHGLGGGSGGVNFASRLELHLTLLAARVEFVRRRSGSIAGCAMRAVIASGAVLRVVAAYARRRVWHHHVRVLRWALTDGRPPSWEAVRAAVSDG